MNKEQPFIKLFFLLGAILISNFIDGQVTTSNNTITPGDYVGSSNSVAIPFKAASTQYGLLTTSGIWGLGDWSVNAFTPVYRLDVDLGDINVNTITNGYRIGIGGSTSDYVLWHNGNTTNIMVGVDAGNSNSFNENTYIGFGAGFNNSNGSTSLPLFPGQHNTFVGHMSGNQNSTGGQNVFLGDSAGFGNDDGFHNAFMGISSGRANTSGFDNTFNGAFSGMSNTTGYHNIFVGAYCGLSNTSGKSNTIIGYEAGMLMSSNEYNTIAGRGAGKAAIGNDNCYYGKDAAQGITGANNVYVGSHSGDDALTGDENTVCGNESGRYFEGNLNCFFGEFSGHGQIVIGSPTVWTGNNNCFFGEQTGAGVNLPSPYIINNSGAFGSLVKVSGSDQIIIGNASHNTGFNLSDDVLFGPRSKVEINADPSGTSITGSYGSGLRFRQLFNGCQINTDSYESPWGMVLTVDQDGIVKLTDGGLSIGLGYCNSPTTLNNNAGMDLNGRKIYYSNMSKINPVTGDQSDAIGLGYSCGNILPGKLSVDQTWTTDAIQANSTAGYFHNGDLADCPEESGPEIVKVAVKGISDGISGNDVCHFNINIGGDFEALNCYHANYGVRGSAEDPSGGAAFNAGGMFIANNAAYDNIGVAGITAGGSSGLNIGVYGESPFTSNCGTGACTDAAGFFNGDIYSTSGNYYPSDLMLKDNVQPLNNSINIIKALNPKSYTYRTSQFPKMRLLNGVQSGLIAQDVQALLPNLVSDFKIPALPDSTGHIDTTGTNTAFLGINYVGLIPYLIGAVKEQQILIDTLMNRLTDLSNELDNCCSGTHLRTTGSSIDVELTNSIILNQNDPNPFSEETRITYSIPGSVNEAKIIFFDNSGKIIQTVKINERGSGQLNVYASNLSSGIYSYTLIADGKIVDTKKMVISK